MDLVKHYTLYLEGTDFLYREAEILDNGQFQEWLQLLTDDITYQVPIRITRERKAASPFSQNSWHLNEDKNSLEMRVARIYTDYNWAEDPPSRTRHFLSNCRLDNVRLNEENTEIDIKSNLLIFRGKFDNLDDVIISAERHDTLRKDNDQWKLAKRLVLLDHTRMVMNNLAIFL